MLLFAAVWPQFKMQKIAACSHHLRAPNYRIVF